MHVNVKTSALLAILAAGLVACSSAPKPSAEMALTRSALQSAEMAGAADLAPIELRLAREKQEQAEYALRKEKFVQAREHTEQARVDADLARARAEAEKSRLALKEIDDSIQLMRNEIDRAQER